VQGALTFTPANSFKYNSDPANLAQHGLHPWYTHLLVNMPMLFGPAVRLDPPGTHPGPPLRLARRGPSLTGWPRQVLLCLQDLAGGCGSVVDEVKGILTGSGFKHLLKQKKKRTPMQVSNASSALPPQCLCLLSMAVLLQRAARDERSPGSGKKKKRRAEEKAAGRKDSGKIDSGERKARKERKEKEREKEKEQQREPEKEHAAYYDGPTLLIILYIAVLSWAPHQARPAAAAAASHAATIC
jgi:hypothetical protein